MVDGRTGKLNAVLVGLIVLVVSGCGLPVPLSYLNYGRLVYDTNQIVQDDTTTTDDALSMTTGMDCKVLNILEDKDVCIER